MTSMRRPTTAIIATLACAAVVTAGCSTKSGGGSSKTSGVTITVALATTPPPQASLDAFTASTGIKVNWSNTDWDSLQTKIAAAATAKTYFADATDVDWSRVGELGKLNWFLPMEKYIDTKSLTADMPQITSFTDAGHVVGIPYDASFLVTTVNKALFAKAGITTMPTTIADYTTDLQQIKAKSVVQYPLNIPFAAAEGLSTYWYQTTAAFGGSILDGAGKPQFATADSAGYKAAQWMVNALKNGLVPPGNINVADSQGQQTLMAKGTVASTFGDYSGNVGSLYDIPDSSSVVNQISYLPTPGVNGVAPNMSNPDGIGIPRQAKYPAAAAKFIEWFTEAQNQADFAGVNGPSKTMVGYFLPSRLSGMTLLTNKGALVAGGQLADMLKNTAKPVFPEGAPSWYPAFSRAGHEPAQVTRAGSASWTMTVGTRSARTPDGEHSHGSAPVVRKRRRSRLDLLPYALVSPLALFIVLLALVPAAFTIIESFYRVQQLDPPNRFSGLDNFRRLFTDTAVRTSIGNTGLYVVIGVALSTVLGVAMAVTLQHRFRGRSVLIAVLILPWALPGVVEGIVWTGIWDSNTGLLNSALTSLHMINHYKDFLGQHRMLTIFAIELVQVWQITTLSALLVLAALQNIPSDLYEAGNLDGCSSWSAFRRITLPLALI